MSEMIDRVARALFDRGYNPAHLSLDEAWKLDRDGIQDWYRESAIAALSAAREPTQAMVCAAEKAHGLLEGFRAENGWRTMIDAALK